MVNVAEAEDSIGTAEAHSAFDPCRRETLAIGGDTTGERNGWHQWEPPRADPPRRWRLTGPLSVVTLLDGDQGDTKCARVVHS
jgi:hypothetical protein